MRSVRLGSTIIDLYPDGLTVTRLAGGADIPAWPQDDDAYRARARDLGYGDDVSADVP